MPIQAELNKNYLQGAYTLSLFPGEDAYHNKMEDLLQEVYYFIFSIIILNSILIEFWFLIF